MTHFNLKKKINKSKNTFAFETHKQKKILIAWDETKLCQFIQTNRVFRPFYFINFFYFSFNKTLLFTTISIPFSFKITSAITKTMYMSVRNKYNYLHNLTPII